MDEEKSLSREYLLESWLELHDAVDAHPGLRRLLFDSVTGLPTTPLLLPRIQALLAERGEACLLCLRVVRYSRIEEIYGWKVLDEVMREIAQVLEAITGTDLRDSDIVAELMVSGSSFVIVLSPPRNADHVVEGDVRRLASRVEARVREELEASMPPALYRKFGCYIGSSIIRADESARLERLVYDGLATALEQSSEHEGLDTEERKARLRDVIERGDLITLVRPVYRLEDLSIVGYEALSRGPAGEFERPDKLLAGPYDAGLILRLERLCRRRAIEAASALPVGRVLFIDIEPEAISDPELRDALLGALLADAETTADRIVLGITERQAIADFASFRSAIEYLRALGFAVAIHDAGAGYASLQALAEIGPEWLKVDMSLVRGIDGDEVRAQLMRGMVTFAERSGARLVAAGIETVDELTAVRGLGVGYGQGFLLAGPVSPFPADEDVTPVFGV